MATTGPFAAELKVFEQHRKEWAQSHPGESVAGGARPLYIGHTGRGDRNAGGASNTPTRGGNGEGTAGRRPGHEESGGGDGSPCAHCPGE